MTIEFRCAQCNQLLRVPDTSAGKNARCPKCKLLMQIPSGGSQLNIPPPPPPNFVPPPPPPSFAPPTANNPAGNPFDFGGGSSISSGSSSRSGVRKKESFDFLGGGAPSSPVPPPPSVSTQASPSGGFNLQTASAPNPYASPRGGQDYAEEPSTKAGKRPGLPWEKAKKKNFKAFMDTAKLVSFEPSKAFSQMQQRGDMGGPMMYSGLGLAIGTIGSELWITLLLFVMLSSFGATAESLGAMVGSRIVSAIVSLVIGVPISATLGNLIGGGILHVCLLICGGSKHPFDTSFRIACYVQSSLSWLMLIPGGMLIMGFWSLAVGIIAVHKAHEVPMGRAVLTVLLPLIVLVVLLVIVVVIFGATVAALLSQQP